MPLFAHDGRFIRTEEMGNFRIISCIGTSWNQEVRNRIRKPLFFPFVPHKDAKMISFLLREIR